jgi:hypothetical protein
MNTRRIRSLVVLTLIAVLAAGTLYVNFNRTPASLPAPMAMEGAELEGVVLLDASAPATGITGPIVGAAVKPVSFDVDVSSLPQIAPARQAPMREMPSPDTGASATDGSGPDPVLQTGNFINAMPAVGQSFKGLDLQNWGAGWPPDTDGDVGPSHYIQAVNTSIGIFNKTGTQLAAFTFNTFFDGTGTPCDANNQGDPVVVYDWVSGRWIITDFAWSSTRGPFYECIAVSKTTDPVSGGWWFYALQASSNALQDYPKLGVWSDGIYMTANMFTRARTYSGAKVWALNRDDMINGLPLRNVAFTLGTSYFSLIPSNALSGNTPPAGTPAFFMSLYAPSTMRMWKFTVNWATPSSSTFTGPTNITVASFTKPTFRIPQKSSSETLDSLGDRLMVQLQYTNLGGTQSLWFNHTVVSSSVAAIRWYEFRNPGGTPTVYQQGTFQPDTTHRWMGSLAVDKLGNMAVGYSASSSTMFPAIRYAGRLAGDTLGQLAQGEATAIAGTGSQSGGYNRWGDYSALSLDPNGCTFWYTTEYYETTSYYWQTRIVSFQYPGCTP